MKFITPSQFCERYQCSRSHLYRLVKRGDITIVKFGRSSRISSDDAEEWVAALPKMGGSK